MNSDYDSGDDLSDPCIIEGGKLLEVKVDAVANQKTWNYYESFDTMDSFKAWKNADKYNWIIGTKANHKVNGQYSYTNYKCSSHRSCKAQVN